MQCEHAHEFLSEYVSGEMDRALVVTLENHLDACSACTDTVEGLRRLWNTLDDMSLVEPPTSFHSSLMQRISAELQIQSNAAAAPRRVRSWRGLLQPHAFAYAAVVLVLLLGAEFVQVQRAGLGPLGLLMNLVHQTPPLQTEQVQWAPNGRGGGLLTLRLQAHPQVNGAIRRDQVRVQLVRKNGAAYPGTRPVARVAELASDRVTTVSLPLDFTPSESTDVIDLTLMPLDSAGAESQTVEVPLGPAP